MSGWPTLTYIWTLEGWLYLAVVLDAHSRKVVGWSMSHLMRTSLVIDALRMALGRRCPDEGGSLLHHSDRGSQYASGAFQDLLTDHNITCSMSRKGNCWDNAMMESFFATLKKERIYHESYATREEARQSVFEYIELFYNTRVVTLPWAISARSSLSKRQRSLTMENKTTSPRTRILLVSRVQDGEAVRHPKRGCDPAAGAMPWKGSLAALP